MFDSVSSEDIIIAFFPCIYFEVQSQLWFSGNNFAQQKWTIDKKCEYSMERHKMLHEFYELINKLVIICVKKNLRLIIENPYTQPHYLSTYWCVKPSIIDMDRTEDGDYYKKPTQYWFINAKPERNLVFEPIQYVKRKKVGEVRVENGVSTTTQRSMIHPQYANRFIRKYIIDYEQKF